MQTDHEIMNNWWSYAFAILNFLNVLIFLLRTNDLLACWPRKNVFFFFCEPTKRLWVHTSKRFPKSSNCPISSRRIYKKAQSEKGTRTRFLLWILWTKSFNTDIKTMCNPQRGPRWGLGRRWHKSTSLAK